MRIQGIITVVGGIIAELVGENLDRRGSGRIKCG
jgi:hypothetical protein